MNTNTHDAQVSAGGGSIVEVVEVDAMQMNTLRNLFQFYEYDFSEIEPSSVGNDGRFHQLDAVTFDHAYLFRVNNDFAGFALVNRQASCLNPGETVWWIKEFFVMRQYRHRGTGRQAAHLVIGRHPGTWEVTQTPKNRAATAFWQKALAVYSYNDMEIIDAKWGRRPLQRFSTD
jgi:predicted acetyltransferase